MQNAEHPSDENWIGARTKRTNWDLISDLGLCFHFSRYPAKPLCRFLISWRWLKTPLHLSSSPSLSYPPHSLNQFSEFPHNYSTFLRSIAFSATARSPTTMLCIVIAGASLSRLMTLVSGFRFLKGALPSLRIT